MILDEEDYIKFLRKVDEGLKEPTSLVPTPKINEAKKLIKEYCTMKKIFIKEFSKKGMLEFFNDSKIISLIENEINNTILGSDINEAEIIIINIISRILWCKYYGENKNLIPDIRTDIDISNNMIIVEFYFNSSDETMTLHKKLI